MPSELLGVIRDEYGRVAYSHKTHEKLAERLSSQVRWEKVLSALLLTVTAGSTIDVLVRNEQASKVTSLIFSALALFLAIYQLSTNTDKLLDQHRRIARALWLLREQYLHLISDIKANAISEDAARARRDELTLRASQIYEAAPDTDAKAYQAARVALQQNEELTFSDREIDLLLPPQLRQGS
jgi:hypothetical protein